MSGNSTGSTAKSGQPARSTHRRASTPTSTFDRVSTNASTRRAPVTLSRAWLAGAALLCALSTASVAGEEAFQSRTFAADPTWQATAGAFAVTGGGAGSLAANPALASELSRPTIALSHLQWAAGLSREWAALSTPLGTRFGVGADFGLLRADALDGFDEAGNPTGTFSPSEWDVAASVGADLGQGFGLGAGVRYFRLEDPTEPLTSVGISAGATWSGETRSFAVSAVDLGSTSDSRYELPTRYRAGAQQWLAPWARLGAGVEYGTELSLSVGTELRPAPWLSLLAGAGQESGDTGRGMFWSTGLGFERSGVHASYAFIVDDVLGDRHQLGIELPLRSENSWRHLDTPEP